MFYIIDQGSRIQTPLKSLLKMRKVKALNETAAIAVVGSEQEKETTSVLVNVAAVKGYQQAAEQSEVRQPAIFAGQIMTKHVITIAVHESLVHARGLFEHHRFHHLPVLDEANRLCGIITDKDIMRFALKNNHANLGQTSVQKVMTQKIISAAETTEIRRIADVMCQQNFGAMPITQENHLLVGVVSRTDILRTLVNEAPLELWV